MSYRFLQPLAVRNTQLKNRIALSAMIKGMCTEDGHMTEQYYAHYAALAKGGAAVITPGAMVIDSQWPYIFAKQPWLDRDECIPEIAHLVELVHEGGAKLSVQLWHPGQHGSTPEKPCKTVNDLSLEEIRHIQGQFLAAAKRVIAAGADAIEFHLAHNFLPAQFLSPYFNKRSDEYGADTIENATRFSVECIKEIKALMPEHMYLSVKINGSDMVDGGTTPEWAAAACQILEKAGADIFSVNAAGPITAVTGMSGGGDKQEGWKVDLAATVKKAVSVPVCANGSIRHPEAIVNYLSDEKCDMVILARGLFAEPNLVSMVEAGREKELRYCLNCGYCFTRPPMGQACCSVNPFAKREYMDWTIKENGMRRGVAILTADVSGLEAAVRLAQRGYRPTVFQDGVFGGVLAELAKDADKFRLNWLLDSYREQLKAWKIPVVEGPITREAVAKVTPCVIFSTKAEHKILRPIAPMQELHECVDYKDIANAVQSGCDAAYGL